MEWIEYVKKMSAQLVENYLNVNKKSPIPENFDGSLKLSFDDLSVFTVEMAKLFANKTFVGKGESQILGMLRHAWWPLNFKFVDFELIKLKFCVF